MSWIRDLKNELVKLVELIEDSQLKKIVLDVLEKPELTYSNTSPVINLEESPAAPRKHHFFTGGLLLHTTSVVKIAIALSEIIGEVYGIRINRDLVIASALLHDIYKYYQYTRDDVYGGYKMREDWYLAHHYALVGELVMRKAPEKLIRVVSEIHGDTPFTTIEGLIVHLADSLDAKLGEILQNIVFNKIKDFESTCRLYKVVDKLITEKNPREIFLLLFEKPDEFREIVNKACSSISAETT